MLDIVEFWERLSDESMGDVLRDLFAVIITFTIFGCILYWVIMFAVRAGALRAHDQIEKEREEAQVLREKEQAARVHAPSVPTNYTPPPASPRP